MQFKSASPRSTAAHRPAPTGARSVARPQAGAAPASPARPAPADGLARVLARSLARRPLLQRMTLEQTGWLPALEDIGERVLVSDGRKVRMYYQKGPEAGTRAAAIATAARLNAAVGKTSDDKAYETWKDAKGWGPRGSWESNWKWTPLSSALGDAALKSLDPFFFATKVPFKIGEAQHTLELTYQHAAGWTGYVESVYDSSNVATSSVPSMYDLSTEAPLKGTKPVGEHYRNLLYSNKHDYHAGTNLLTSSTGATDVAFDAYTKLAGEGARWQCVRKHGAALQDDSMFFVSHTDGTKRGISFRVLWLNWRDVFNKAYDIPDGEVAAAIRSGMAKVRRTPVARGQFARDDIKLVTAAAKDYDLDTGLPGA